MLEKNSPLSWLQVSSIILGAVLGAGLLTLSRSVYEKAGPTSILALAATGLLILIAGLFLVKVILNFPNTSYFNIIDKVVGKPLGFFIKSYYVLYLIIVPTIPVRLFTEAVNEFLLLKTPRVAIIIFMVLAAGYLAIFDLQVLGRLNEFVAPLVVLAVSIPVIISLIENLQPLFLLPLFPLETKKMFQASLASSFSYLGYELILFLIPYMQTPKEGYKAQGVAITAITFVYFLVVISGIGILGETLLSIQWPTLEIIRIIELPITFFEKLDTLFLTIWVFAIFTTIANYYSLATKGLSELLGLSKHQYSIIPIGIIITVLALLPPSLEVIGKVSDFISIFGLGGAVTIPILIYLISFVRGINTNG